MTGGSSERARSRVRARDAALVALWIVAGSLAALAIRTYFFTDYEDPGVDAHAYWAAARSDDPYDTGPGDKDAYLYSPAFLQLVSPLAALPFPLFFSLWAVAEGTCYAWLLKPLGWRWGLPLWLACIPQLILGNIVGFLGVALVLGVTTRRSEAWAFPLLTKLTLGAIGVVWFLTRGQWRALARLAAVASALTALSFALDPQLWWQWADFLRAQPGGAEVAVRFGLAIAGVVLAARTNRFWLLAPMMLLATPVLGGINVVAFLAAVPRLAVAGGVRRDQPEHAVQTSEETAPRLDSPSIT